MDLVKFNTEQEFIDYWQDQLHIIVYDTDEFATNQDHGLPHSWRVWQKSQEVMADIQESIREDIVHLGCVFHDSGRVDPEEKELNVHHIIGVGYLAEWVKYRTPEINTSKFLDLCDIVVNHDYINERISGGRISPPRTTEGQIVRATDKMMSSDPAAEVDRYWAYGKRKGEVLYKPQDSLHNEILFRINWTPAQYSHPWSDQLCWFCIIFEKQEFGHTVIQSHYDEWAKQKQKAVDRIIALAIIECPEHVQRIGDVIIEYKKQRRLKW